MTVSKPLPVPDEFSAEFWKAAAQHVLAIQCCTHCGTFSHPPGIVCRSCLHETPEWCFKPVSGQARIRTWTIFRQAFLPGFAADVPYVVIEAELIEQPGLRMIGKLIDGPDAELAIGAPVETVFDDVAPGVSIPHFRMAATR